MKRRLPKYPPKPHSSGQARVKVDGQPIYLGKHGSTTSHEKYHRLIADLLAGKEPSTTQEPRQPGTYTINELVDAHRVFAEDRYKKNGKQTSEVKSFKTALRPVIALYGSQLTDKFGPTALIACRQELIEKKYTRKRINQHVDRIRRVFKWGVSREMVSVNTLIALRTVPGLVKGEAGTVDRPKIKPVPPADVEAIKGKVLPTIWAMIQLQLLTGCRPGEACLVRTCDVFQDDPDIPVDCERKVWLYRPNSHKTEHHERERPIFLGPKAQELIRAWLLPDRPEAYIFSPREAVEFARLTRRENAKFPPRKFKRKSRPKRRPAEQYTEHAYAHAIAVACKKVGVKRWAPNRLRHQRATELRKMLGLDTSRTVLGHASVTTAQIYAEADLQKAAEAMARLG